MQIDTDRLSGMVKEKDLLGEEQGGFQKERGCRDQGLSLVLLGKMKILKKAHGIMITFIDFSKAYDNVDRDKLWKSIGKLGMNGKFLGFVQSLYWLTSCQATVGV